MGETLRVRLEATLGAGAVAEDAAGAADGGGRETLTLFPSSEDAVAAAVRLCREARTPLIPTGGGTLMEVGGPPPPGAVRLSLSRLTRLIEHDDANLTVTAQAGMTIAALQEVLRARAQFAVLDTPRPGRATLGGVVAVNLNGYRRTTYRSIRDLVIGMRVVIGAGEIVKAGGKVVKNVAGYDMCKLFVGSLGTLAIITEVTARVEPVPEAEATLVLGSPGAGGASGAGAAVAAAEALVASHLLPTAVVLLNGAAAHRLLGYEGETVLVRLEGFPAVIERQEREIRRLASEVVRRLDGAAHAAAWDGLLGLGWEGPAALMRVIVPRGRLADAWQALASGAAPGEMAADVLSGTIWLTNGDGDGAASFHQGVEAAASLAERGGGHLLIARVPPGVPPARAGDRWRPTPATLPLMRALKQSFDPDGILNPGRFLV